MSLPTYCEYADSDITWAGAVPKHWSIKPLKSIARIVNGFPFDSKLFDPHEGTPLVRIRDLGSTTSETRYKVSE